MKEIEVLSERLGALHRVLIGVEVGEDKVYEDKYVLLNALMGEPRFQWLRAISGLMVALDEMEGEGREELGEARAMTEKVIGPRGMAGGDFAEKFEKAMLASVEAAGALAEVRVVLGRMPGEGGG